MQQSPSNAPGLFGWNELITSDREAAKQFYAATFGWVAETREMAPGLNIPCSSLVEPPWAA